ncbi:nucleoside-diphosphate-sugar epimerase [Ulvibacter sp. MAR_2010_11]|uniref:NAD(P)H-binding protein n=1 Tax=Ulvibacter sp. MAR_2010_11 TaxID=1250229 RepID=UPI000C2B7194|nr:NAD(P)H-binding protein [Ulvibacter sp. MAR_2010_11]PKA82818.1 nucleoside-diphosphate-sugar epimerase [Ulvibacter sp. MAR_2010_11]
MNKKIAIAGMGWLGLPFAQHLTTLGFVVKGSVTNREKATTLQKKGFNVFPMEISETGVTGEVQAFLKEIDILIVMIPPGLRRHTGADYVLKMSHFLTEVEKASVENVIFISSTGVYDDAQGRVSEKNLPKPTSRAGKQLLQVEQLFFYAPFLKTTVVRFGGLFGGSRQPARYLAGRENLNDSNAPVNLIHREDCIGILTNIIKQNAFGHIFNGVTPQHPSKKEYYTQKCKELNLIPPHFLAEDAEAVYKEVVSENLKGILGYRFTHSL